MSRQRPTDALLETCVVRVRYSKKGPCQFTCQEVSVEPRDGEKDVPSRYATPVFRDGKDRGVPNVLELSHPARLDILVYDADAVDWHQDDFKGDTKKAEMRCHKALREGGGFPLEKNGDVIPEGQCCRLCAVTNR